MLGFVMPLVGAAFIIAAIMYGARAEPKPLLPFILLLALGIVCIMGPMLVSHSASKRARLPASSAVHFPLGTHGVRILCAD